MARDSEGPARHGAGGGRVEEQRVDLIRLGGTANFH
jgi:hypothetical protein